MSRQLIGILIALTVFTAACGATVGTTTTTPTVTTTSTTSVPETTVAPTTQPVADDTATSVPATSTTVEPVDDVLDFGQWILVLASLATDEFDQADAAARTRDIEGSNVLLSDDYPSLNAGYWVVYAGPYDVDPTVSACPADLPAAFTCYPRFIGETANAAGNIVVQLPEGIRQIDPTTGEFVGNLLPFSLEASWYDRFTVTNDGSAAFYGLGEEDFWFDCESSRGTVERVDLITGKTDQVYPGRYPQISPDGTRIAVIDASECIPDPAESQFVLTLADQVQIYDLSQGVAIPVTTFEIEGPIDPNDLGRTIADVHWLDNDTLLVFQASATVLRVELDSQTVVTDGLAIAQSEDFVFPTAIVGFDVYFSDVNLTGPGISRLYRRNVITGDKTPTDITTDSWIIGSANGDDVVFTTFGRVYINGELLTDLGGEILTIGW